MAFSDGGSILFIAVTAASGAGLFLVNLRLYGEAMAAQRLALGVMVADLMMTVAMPGLASISGGAGCPAMRVPFPSAWMPRAPQPAPNATGADSRSASGGCSSWSPGCAPLFWMGRELWDRRSGNRPARAFRILRSEDPSARLSSASDLRILPILNSLTPKQVDDAIADLLVAIATRIPACARSPPSLSTRSSWTPPNERPPCRESRPWSPA